MNIPITFLKTGAVPPQYQTAHSAGMDLCAAIDSPITLRPLQRALVGTGIAIALPAGYEAQVRARSGLALKHGIALVNGIGTIDADYRGEIGVLLINLGDQDFVIASGDRIAQLVIARYKHITWQRVDELPSSKRGEGGFGSTGKTNIS